MVPLIVASVLVHSDADAVVDGGVDVYVCFGGNFMSLLVYVSVDAIL